MAIKITEIYVEGRRATKQEEYRMVRELHALYMKVGAKRGNTCKISVY
jgi:hypothetical protein